MEYLGNSIGPIRVLRQKTPEPPVTASKTEEASGGNIASAHGELGTSDLRTALRAALQEELPAILESFRGVLSTELSRHLEAASHHGPASTSVASQVEDEHPAKGRQSLAGRLAMNAKNLGDDVLSSVRGKTPQSKSDQTNFGRGRDLGVLSARIQSMRRPQAQRQQNSSVSGGRTEKKEEDIKLEGGQSEEVYVLSLEDGGASGIESGIVEAYSQGMRQSGENERVGVAHEELTKALLTAMEKKLEEHRTAMELLLKSLKRSGTMDSRWDEDPLAAAGFMPVGHMSSLASRMSYMASRRDNGSMKDLFPGPQTQVDLYASVTSVRKSSLSSLALERLSQSRRVSPQILGIDMIKWVDSLSFVLVVSNAVVMGIVEHRRFRMAMASASTDHVGDFNFDEPEWAKYSQVGFASAFLLEICARLYLTRIEFCAGPDRWWNLFDVALTCASWVELLTRDVAISFGRVLRAFRIMRVLRVFQRFDELRPMRLMLQMVSSCFSSVGCAIGLFCMASYMVSIFFMQGATSHIIANNGDIDDAWREGATKYLSGMANMMATLICTVIGGINMEDFLSTLETMGVMYAVILILFILLVVFAFMHMVGGLFLFTVTDMAARDRKLSVQAQLEQVGSPAFTLKDVLREKTREQPSLLSKEYLETALEAREAKKCLSTLDISLGEVRSTFQLLDVQGIGEVDVNDLVAALLRLKGAAQTIDMLTLIYSNRRLSARMDDFMRSVAAAFAATAEISEKSGMASGGRKKSAS